MLIKIENGVPVGEPPIDERNFRQLHSNTSFPRILTPEDVESFGYGLFQQTSQPEPAKFMKCVEDTPVKNESGFYVQTWKRTAMSSEEIENATKLRAKEVQPSIAFACQPVPPAEAPFCVATSPLGGV